MLSKSLVVSIQRILKERRKYIRIAVYSTCSFILILAILLTFVRPLGLDSSIILKEMESVSEGYIPYKTLHLNYPPLFFYLMALLKRIFNVPYGCYNFYLAVHYLLLLCIGYFIYIVSRFFGGNRFVSLLTSWICLILIIWYEGCMVLFEVPSMFFGLASSALIAVNIKRGQPFLFILSGMFAICAFLIKQFGAAFIPLNIYLLLISVKNRKRACYYFILGVFIPLLIVLSVFGANFIESTLLNGYGTTTNKLAGEDISLHAKGISIVKGIGDVFVMCPIALLFLLSPFAIIERKWKKLLFCIMGFLLFSLQFYFVYPCGLHYFQYFVPVIVLIIPILSTVKMPKYIVFTSYTCCVLTVLYGLVITIYSPIKLFSYYLEQKSYQKKLANVISLNLPEKKTLWIANTDCLVFYYLVNCKTADMKNFGYSSGPWEVTEDKARSQVNSVDYILCRYDTITTSQQDYYLTDDMKAVIYGHPYKMIADNIRLYKMM